LRNWQLTIANGGKVERARIWLRHSKTSSLAQVLLVLLGKSANAGLGFLASVIVARTIGVESFGIYSGAIAIIAIGGQLAGQSLDTAFVRFLSSYWDVDHSRAKLVAAIVFWLHVVTSIVVLGIGLPFADSIAVAFFHDRSLGWLVRIASIGVVGSSFWTYLLSSVQAKQQFTRYTWMSLIVNGLKTGILLSLLVTGALELESALIASVSAFLLSLFIGTLFTSTLSGIKIEPVFGDLGLLKEILRFGGWTTVVSVLFTIHTRLDIVMLSVFRSPREVGEYSAAAVLISNVDLITVSLITVLFPKVTRLIAKKGLRKYVARVLLLSSIIATLFLPWLVFADPLIALIFGSRMSSSVMIFRVLFVAFMITFITDPVYLVIYALNKPQVVAYVEASQLAVTVAMNLVLIPVFGALGAAITVLISRLMAGILFIVFSYKVTAETKESVSFSRP